MPSQILNLMPIVANSIQRASDATNAEDFVNETKFVLEELFETLTDNWNSYKIEYAKIFNEDNDQSIDDAIEAEFVATEAIYMTARSRIRKRIAELTQPLVSTQPNVIIEQPNASSGIENSWGYFNGDYAQWPSFRNKFNAQIHIRHDIWLCSNGIIFATHCRANP